LAFVVPHEESEGSQSYYSESSDENENKLKEAYKILYVKFSKLREIHQQYMQELNSLRTEKSMMLMKITNLEEKQLETQLQIERLTDEKLTHMLSVHKSLTYRTGLGYVAFTSDIPSTSKNVFVKPTVPEPPPACMDKGKAIIGEDVLSVTEPTQMPPSKREPPICHQYGLSGHIRPKCRLLRVQRLKVKKKPPRKATHVLDVQTSIRLLSISYNSGDLFLPIKMENPRRTNQGTTRRSREKRKVTNLMRGCLFLCGAC
jgi:hypothetical protein